jgi:hypothetical protein
MTDHDDTHDIGAAILAASATVQAPDHLRAAVAPTPARVSRRERSLRPFALAAGLLACLVALAIAFAPGGNVARAPGVADAASIALRAPTEPAPRGADGHLRLSSGGIRFPDYDSDSGWRAVGARSDRIGGHTAISVSYTRDGWSAGYAIVDGAPLAVPAGARTMVYDGLRVAVFEQDGVRIVTWRRDGRTCIVAARGTRLEPLLELASRA